MNKKDTRKLYKIRPSDICKYIDADVLTAMKLCAHSGNCKRCRVTNQGCPLRRELTRVGYKEFIDDFWDMVIDRMGSYAEIEYKKRGKYARATESAAAKNRVTTARYRSRIKSDPLVQRQAIYLRQWLAIKKMRQCEFGEMINRSQSVISSYVCGACRMPGYVLDTVGYTGPRDEDQSSEIVTLQEVN